MTCRRKKGLLQPYSPGRYSPWEAMAWLERSWFPVLARYTVLMPPSGGGPGGNVCALRREGLGPHPHPPDPNQTRQLQP